MKIEGKVAIVTGGRCGSISSCCGGGQGSTAIIENLRR